MTKPAFSVGDRQTLEKFLTDLICEMKQPEHTDLIVEVLLTLQHTPQATPNRLGEPIPINRPATRSQDPEG